MNLQKKLFFFVFLTIIQKTYPMDCQDRLIKTLAEIAKQDFEIQDKFDLLFTVHLELIRDKLREIIIILPNETTSPIRLVYPFEDISTMIKKLQKNRHVFHTFIKKQCLETLPRTIDHLISDILDLKEEISGYYTRIKEQIFVFYTFPLEQEELIKNTFRLLETLLYEFDYPTPYILKESRKRIKAREKEILAHFHTSK